MRKILSLLTAVLFSVSMMALEANVTIYASSGDYYAKTNNWVKGSESGPAYEQVVLDDNITANLIGTGNNGKYYSDWRFYTNGSDDGSFSIDAASGYELQSVTFEFTVSNNGALYSGETKLTSKTPFEVSGNKAVFQCKNTNTNTNGQVRLTKIGVTYKSTGGVTPPVSNVKTIYCKMEQSWWKADGAAVAAFAWTEGGAANADFPGVRMTPVEGETDIWQIALDMALYNQVIFARVNGSGDVANWGAQTEDLALPTDEKDMFTITNTTATWTGDNKKCTGEWSKFVPTDPTIPPVAASYYMKNNWDGGDWSWKEMTEVGLLQKLENVVFGGTGVNVSTSMDVADPKWIPVADFLGDAVAALDTVTFEYDPQADTLHVYLIGQYAGGEVPPVVNTKTLQLVPGVWANDNAVLAVWAWKTGGEGAWSVFSGEGTLSAEINAEADYVKFVRFAAGVTNPAWDGSATIWNETNDTAFNTCAIFYVNDWDNYTWCEPAGDNPPVGPTSMYTIKFNGTGEADTDNSKEYTASVEAIFDAASQAYIGEVTAVTKVYAARPIDGENSSLKFGSTKAQGSLTFTLATPIAIDSIVVNATQYGSNTSKITVNGTEYTLDSGNKVPQNCVWTSNATLSEITIAQSTSERLYLRYIEVYPKGGDTPTPPVATTYYMKNNWDGGDWSWKEMTEDGLLQKLENVVFGGTGVNVSTSTDVADPKWIPVADFLGDNVAALDTVTFEYDPQADTLHVYLIGKHETTPIGDMIEIRLVPGVWNVDGAKFACLTTNQGTAATVDIASLTMSAVISDWFVGGDTVVALIPADTKVIAFGRLNPAAPDLSIASIMTYLWNHSDILDLDPSLIYTITDWGTKDYSPGYWGEKPVDPDPEWYLAGDMTDWQTGMISFANGPIEVNLTDVGRDYGFKIVKKVGDATTWYGNNGTMTREYHENWIFSDAEQSNCKITTDMAGSYTFSLNLEDGVKVTVTYPNGTGVDNVNATIKAEKVLRNGQVLIIRGEHIYTTMGQMVK